MRAVLGFLGGYLLGHASAVLGYIIATNFFGVFDRDGGGAMSTIFILGPILGLVGGVTGAVLASRWRRRQ